MPTINSIIRRRVDELTQEVEKLKNRVKKMEQTFPWDMKRISIDLPDHLRKTYEALLDKPKTAEEIAIITRRARAVESAYLNILVIMKLATKNHAKRKVVFSVNQK